MNTFALLLLLPAFALAADVTEAQIKLAEKLFKVIDTNKDDIVTEAETEAYFLSYDSDKDGKISQAEFTSAVDKVDPAFVAHEDKLYKLFDRDNNAAVNKADIDAVFKIADINKDNKVDKSEFVAILALIISHTG